jgi:hypothetical protein
MNKKIRAQSSRRLKHILDSLLLQNFVFTYRDDFEEGGSLNASSIVDSNTLKHSRVGAYQAEYFQVVAMNGATRRKRK